MPSFEDIIKSGNSNRESKQLALEAFNSKYKHVLASLNSEIQQLVLLSDIFALKDIAKELDSTLDILKDFLRIRDELVTKLCLHCWVDKRCERCDAVCAFP